MIRILKKFLAVSLVLSVLIAMPACTQSEVSGYKDEFSPDKIMTINIELSDADLQNMLQSPQDKKYFAADVTINGTTVKNVGVRTKGNISLKTIDSDLSQRYSLRIKFDKYVKGQKYKGLDEMVVNNMYHDPSYMREFLHYEALRELEAAVPETAYASVTVNGESYGFFLAVEAADNSFLKNNFGKDYKLGNFYQMNEGATLLYREDENYSYAELKKGEDNTKVGLRNLIKILQDMPYGHKGDIESVLDVDSALVYIASNTVMGNYDSYNGNQHHNYYMYESPDGKFTVIPWDFNMSFGGFGGGDLTEIGIQTPMLSNNIRTLPLIYKLLSVPEYYERYTAYIEKLCEHFEDFEERVNTLADKLRPYIESDPSRFYTMEEFEASISPTETSNASMRTTKTEMPQEQPPEMPREQPPEMPQEQPPEMLQEQPPEMLRDGFDSDVMAHKPNDGDDMRNTGGSIVVYMKKRLENLRLQLEGKASQKTENADFKNENTNQQPTA